MANQQHKTTRKRTIKQKRHVSAKYNRYVSFRAKNPPSRR